MQVQMSGLKKHQTVSDVSRMKDSYKYLGHLNPVVDDHNLTYKWIYSAAVID